MKNLLVVTALTSLTACTNIAPTKMYQGEKGLSNLSVVTYQCSGACKAAVRKHIEKAYTSYGPHIMSSSVTSVNGERGTHSFEQHNQVFNDPANWGYEFHLEPGMQTFKLKVNHHQSYSLKEATVNFKAEQGKTYFVGQALSFVKYPYAWTPVVVDLSNLEVIFPAEQAVWLNN